MLSRALGPREADMMFPLLWVRCFYDYPRSCNVFTTKDAPQMVRSPLLHVSWPIEYILLYLLAMADDEGDDDDHHHHHDVHDDGRDDRQVVGYNGENPLRRTGGKKGVCHGA